MSELRIYPENDPTSFELSTDHQAIAAALGDIGVRFERWDASAASADADEETILEAYADDVKRIMDESGFQSVDVIRMVPDHPQKDAFRAKFLNEHRHADFEIRYFVAGAGQFNIHRQDKVFSVVCEAGDLISVPDNTPHWFDMGPAPSFTCIRFFTTPEGWVAQFTGDAIADKFPRFE